MNNASIREYLNQYLRAHDYVRQLLGRLEELRQNSDIKAARIHSEGLVRRSHYRVSDPTGTHAVQIADLSDILAEAQLCELDAMENVCAVLDAIENPVHSRLLFDRYIKGMSWEQVAAAIKLEPVYVRGRLFTVALRDAEQILHSKEKEINGTKV